MLHGEPEERSRLDPAGKPFVTDNLAALVNGIVDPILVIDVHGEVLFVIQPFRICSATSQ